MEAGIYKHYKGGFYQVLGVGQHTETKELVVVYLSLDAAQPGPRLRVRPLDGPEGFNTKVRIREESNRATESFISVPRFAYVGYQL